MFVERLRVEEPQPHEKGLFSPPSTEAALSPACVDDEAAQREVLEGQLRAQARTLHAAARRRLAASTSR